MFSKMFQNVFRICEMFSKYVKCFQGRKKRKREKKTIKESQRASEFCYYLQEEHCCRMQNKQVRLLISKGSGILQNFILEGAGIYSSQKRRENMNRGQEGKQKQKHPRDQFRTPPFV